MYTKINIVVYLTVSLVLFQCIKLGIIVYYAIYKPMCYVRLILSIRAKTIFTAVCLELSPTPKSTLFST